MKSAEIRGLLMEALNRIASDGNIRDFTRAFGELHGVFADQTADDELARAFRCCAADLIRRMVEDDRQRPDAP